MIKLLKQIYKRKVQKVQLHSAMMDIFLILPLKIP